MSSHEIKKIVDRLDADGKARVLKLERVRIRSINNVREASLRKGTYTPSQDRTVYDMLNGLLLREAKYQERRKASRERARKEREKMRKERIEYLTREFIENTPEFKAKKRRELFKELFD